MPVSFGFSVGDFLTVIQLTVRICQALDESSSELKDYRDVKEEVSCLGHVVEDFRSEVLGGSVISERNAKRLKDILGNCTQALTDFQSFLSSYKEVQSVFKKVSWVASGRSKLGSLRSRIQVNMVTLNLIQQEMQREALVAIRSEISKGNDNVSLQIQQQARSFETNVISTIQWQGDQQPIKFQDAIGRRYPVTLELCKNFDDFMEFLEFAFKDYGQLRLAINRRDIFLFTPRDAQRDSWFLLQEGDWARIARPGMTLGMSILPPFHSAYEELQATAVPIGFVKPLPPWAEYNCDAEFQFTKESLAVVDKPRRGMLSPDKATKLLEDWNRGLEDAIDRRFLCQCEPITIGNISRGLHRFKEVGKDGTKLKQDTVTRGR